MTDGLSVYDRTLLQMARLLDAILLVRAGEHGCVTASRCPICCELSFGAGCPGCTPTELQN